MSGLYTGGCQCGAIRYRVNGSLADPHICHCRMCQKAAGNYFMPFAGVQKSDLEITRGEISWFFSSEPVRRGFCSNCGTPLAIDTVSSEHIHITLGSLDKPAEVRPVSVYGEEARMPWIAEICAASGTATESETGEERQLIAQIAATNRQHPDHDTNQWEERQ
ncbi:MAG: GFA family protein [Rhizobiaceae bacterium]